MAEAELPADKQPPGTAALLTGILMGAALLVIGLVGFGYFVRQAVWAAGFAGRAGHLTVTGCRPDLAGPAESITFTCRGDFVASSGGFAAADVRLVGDDKDRAVGAVVPARYADGDARRTGIATALLWLLPGFLAAVLAAGGGALLVNGVRRLLR